MRDNARIESVEEIRASSVKRQPTNPSTHEYERAMLTARSYSLGRAGGTASVRLLRLSRCRVCFLRSFLRSLCTVGIEQPSPPGPRKARLLVLMETVELRSHRFHSVTTATE